MKYNQLKSYSAKLFFKAYTSKAAKVAVPAEPEEEHDNNNNIWNEFYNELPYGQQLDVVQQMSNLDRDLVQTDNFYSNGFEVYKKEDPLLEEEYIPEVIWRAQREAQLRAAPQYGDKPITVAKGEVDWFKEWKWYDMLLDQMEFQDQVKAGNIPVKVESLFDLFDEVSSTTIYFCDPDEDQDSILETHWAPPHDNYVGVYKERDRKAEIKDDIYETILLNKENLSAKERLGILIDAENHGPLEKGDLNKFLDKMKWNKRTHKKQMRIKSTEVLIATIMGLTTYGAVMYLRTKVRALYQQDKEFNTTVRQATEQKVKDPASYTEKKLGRTLHHTKEQWNKIFNALDTMALTV